MKEIDGTSRPLLYRQQEAVMLTNLENLNLDSLRRLARSWFNSVRVDKQTKHSLLNGLGEAFKSVKRESLVLRTGVSLFAFTSPEASIAYLNQNAGTACGDQFVISKTGVEPATQGVLVIDHRRTQRRTLALDEDGSISTTQSLDLEQTARLRRMARSTPRGWQLSAESLRQASAGGFKLPLVRRWLDEHLLVEIPPLLALTIDAWLGKQVSMELGKAVLLHIADDHQFEVIATSPRLATYFLGSPGPL